MKYISIILLVMLSLPSNACRPNFYYIKDQIEKSPNVYLGRVTGIRDVSYEKSLQEKGDNEIITIPGEHEMRFFVNKTLKGESKTVLNSGGPFCGRYYDIRGKVFVFQHTNHQYYFALSENDLKDLHPDVYKKLSNLTPLNNGQ